MRKLLPFLMLMVFVVAACRGSDDTVTVVDDVEITFSVDPEPAAVGETTVVVTLTESDGTPIDGATIHVHADMDHAGMIPVETESSTSDTGTYQVPLTWTMGGGWIVEVNATLPGDRGVATETFELFVEAISRDSIINQDPDATEEAYDMDDMDHEDNGDDHDMDNMNHPEATEESS